MAIERDADGTIHTPNNLPVDMPRRPQLGDTSMHFGGEPLPQVDTTFPDEMRPKGLALGEPGSEVEALRLNLGGPSTANFPSPEKNISHTDEHSQFSNTGEVVITEASLRWTDGVEDAWFIRDEATASVMAFPTYAQAYAYFDTHERARWLSPDQDEVAGWKAVEIASHVSGDPGMTATTTPQASAASDTLTLTPPEVVTTFDQTNAPLPTDALAVGDGSNAVGTGPLV